MIQLEDLIIVMEQGGFGYLKFDFEGIDDNGIEKKFLKEPITHLIYSRKCLEGEEYTS